MMDGSNGGILASEGWRSVSDRLIAGLCHELNDRISALAGIVHIARMEAALDPAMIQLLDGELARLEEASRLLRALPDDGGAGPEPVHLPELIPLILGLHRHHNGLEEVPIDVDGEPGSPPVVARWSHLSKALLVLLAAAARAAAPAGRVRLQYRGEGGDLLLRIAASGGHGGGHDGNARNGIAAARAVFVEAGGDLVEATAEDGAPAYEARLPGLRRRDA
jgi:signal transduction histidine kinase